MSGQPSLTDEQREAVEAPDGAYYVLAPPGSGKTEVLVRRALWLVERSADEPFRVLAITYTNKGAEELRERAAQRLGEDAWRVDASTFHAFCLDMLDRYGEAVGVTSGVGVYDTDDLRLEVLAEALRGEARALDEVDRDEVLSLLRRIDELRMELTPPGLAPATPVLDGDVTLAEAYELYEQALTDTGMLDFPAMLLRGHRLLLEDPWVGEHYRRQYRHLLVDEAQDLNKAQLEILRALCGTELRNVFIVADHDQELFGFTGASARYAADFAEELGARALPLTSNFRCARDIVAAAERLRQHISTLKVGRPPAVPAVPAEGWIGVRPYPDPAAEAEGVAAWVAELLKTGLPASWLHTGEDPALASEDVCVMARTRFGFDPLTEAFDDAGLPFLLRTEEGGMFDSVTGRMVYLALRVVANPRDGASCKRLESLIVEELRASKAAEPRAHYARAPDEDGVAVLRGVGLPHSMIEAFAEASVTDGYDLDRLVARLQAIPIVVEDDGQGREGDLWLADQRRLGGQWESYCLVTRVSERSLNGLLRQLSRVQRASADERGVRFLTPYRAKGLQFRVVAITGMNVGSFPHYRSTTERKIDEERRAVYVAVTRASRAVLLTRPVARVDRYERVHRDAPSPFLAELGLAGD